LSDAPPTILSYAPRDYAAGQAETPSQLYFVFERPDARKEFFTRCAGLFVAAFGFVVVVLMAYTRYRSARGLEPLVGLTSALGIFAMIITSCACLWGLLRTWRFRDTSVTIRVADGHVIVSDPVGLGPLPRVVPMLDIRSCMAKYEALTGSEFRIYKIVFRMRSWGRRRISVRIAVGEKGIVERAAADLQRAIDACAASPTTELS
jgi:hypothetical protein